MHEFGNELVVAGWGGQLATWRLRVTVKHDGLQSAQHRIHILNLISGALCMYICHLAAAGDGQT
jgi:hypothetical protein